MCESKSLHMHGDAQWYFTDEELENTPSRRKGMSSDRERLARQNTAAFIQEVGRKLRLHQICISTSIVYMHRFFKFHSFTDFNRNEIGVTALYIASKIEDEPRGIQNIIDVAVNCLQQWCPSKTHKYLDNVPNIIFNEEILLQTLGFNIAIKHPHIQISKTCSMVRACKDMIKAAHFLATNSLHLTTFCLRYRPHVIAAFCIYLASKWGGWHIPLSIDGTEWFLYIDSNITMELLEQITNEYVKIYEKSPTKVKEKLNELKMSPADPKIVAISIKDPQINNDLDPIATTAMDLASQTRKQQPGNMYANETASSSGTSSRSYESRQPSSNEFQPNISHQHCVHPSTSQHSGFYPIHATASQTRKQQPGNMCSNETVSSSGTSSRSYESRQPSSNEFQPNISHQHCVHPSTSQHSGFYPIHATKKSKKSSTRATSSKNEFVKHEKSQDTPSSSKVIKGSLICDSEDSNKIKIKKEVPEDPHCSSTSEVNTLFRKLATNAKGRVYSTRKFELGCIMKESVKQEVPADDFCSSSDNHNLLITVKNEIMKKDRITPVKTELLVSSSTNAELSSSDIKSVHPPPIKLKLKAVRCPSSSNEQSSSAPSSTSPKSYKIDESSTDYINSLLKDKLYSGYSMEDKTLNKKGKKRRKERKERKMEKKERKRERKEERKRIKTERRLKRKHREERENSSNASVDEKRAKCEKEEGGNSLIVKISLSRLSDKFLRKIKNIKRKEKPPNISSSSGDHSRY